MKYLDTRIDQRDSVIGVWPLAKENSITRLIQLEEVLDEQRTKRSLDSFNTRPSKPNFRRLQHL